MFVPDRPAREDLALRRRGRRATRRCRKLGGKRWETMKARARRAAQELAGELLNLYAERRRRTGHAFPRRLRLAARVRGRASRSPRRPTSARRSSSSRPTWRRARPMDRLICGDVGYGKTEVALRAAFKAADDGKQVLMLVPTTILAQQHYGTFAERLTRLPVHDRARLALPHARPSSARRSAASHDGQRRHPDRHPPRCSRATCAPKDLGPADRRRGAALRRQAEGAAAPAQAAGRRDLDVRRRRSRARCRCRSPGCATSR